MKTLSLHPTDRSFIRPINLVRNFRTSDIRFESKATIDIRRFYHLRIESQMSAAEFVEVHVGEKIHSFLVRFEMILKLLVMLANQCQIVEKGSFPLAFFLRIAVRLFVFYLKGRMKWHWCRNQNVEVALYIIVGF